MSVERRTLYLKPGAKATARLIEAVSERGREGDLRSVVVASTKGKTAIRLGEALKDVAEVIGVTEFTYSDDVKKSMKKLKVKAVEKADLPIQDRREMREALMLFGAGVKASLEVASVAAEKGLVEGNVRAVAEDAVSRVGCLDLVVAGFILAVVTDTFCSHVALHTGVEPALVVDVVLLAVVVFAFVLVGALDFGTQEHGGCREVVDVGEGVGGIARDPAFDGVHGRASLVADHAQVAAVSQVGGQA